jgi:hypothetical protein
MGSTTRRVRGWGLKGLRLCSLALQVGRRSRTGGKSKDGLVGLRWSWARGSSPSYWNLNLRSIPRAAMKR